MFTHKRLTKSLLYSGVALGLLMSSSAMAVPSLQLFIEQADYETPAENSVDSSTWAKLGTTSFRLWVMGDISSGNPNVLNRLRDVTFVASFASTLSPGLQFTPAVTSVALSGFADPSMPSDPDDGSGDQINVYPNSADIPGDPISNHSPFGAPGRTAVTWNLGMFNLQDSPLGNVEPSTAVEAIDNWFASPLSQMGQINVYDMLVSGMPVGAQAHFDVFGVLQKLVTTYGNGTTCLNVQNGNGPNAGQCTLYNQVVVSEEWVDVMNGSNLSYVSSANSHDARWEQIAEQSLDVPEPMALSLMGLGLIGVAGFRRKRAA